MFDKVKTGTVQKWPVPVLHYSSDSVSVVCVSWEGSFSVSAVSDAALFRCTYPRSDTQRKAMAAVSPNIMTPSAVPSVAR